VAERESGGSRRPGPRRPPGAPSGPDEVRRAILDAAATLFSQRGLADVSLRDIAAAADTHLALIGKYVGTREQLEMAVFDDLSAQLAESVREHPLEGQGHGIDTVMGKWSKVATALVIRGRTLAGRPGFNPVMAMANTIADAYGLEPLAARVRSAQIVATAIGWRIFEDYLVEAGQLNEVPLASLREELVHSGRRLGATPWPSPPDPTPDSP
jgi:AcrR family transcriptional regulator